MLVERKMILRSSRDKADEDADQVEETNEYAHDLLGGGFQNLEEQQRVFDHEEEAIRNKPSIVEEKTVGLLQSLSYTMKEHVGVQEKILKRLASNNTSITDHSMNLLRSAETKESQSQLRAWEKGFHIQSSPVEKLTYIDYRAIRRQIY